MTVLVLDRDREFCKEVRKEFQWTRFSSTKRGAVKAAAEFQPSVIVVDKSFYGKDGKEISAELKAVCPRAELVIVGAGHVGKKDKKKLRAALVKAREKVTSNFVAVHSFRLQ